MNPTYCAAAAAGCRAVSSRRSTQRVVCYWLGGWRDNPLFEAASSTPACTVRVLTPEERTQAYGEPHRPA